MRAAQGGLSPYLYPRRKLAKMNISQFSIRCHCLSRLHHVTACQEASFTPPMASTLKPLHRSSAWLRLPCTEGPRILGLGLRWRPHKSNKDGAGPSLGFPGLPRHHARHPLPPIPLRLQVLPPPLCVRLLHQLRPHRPLTMASADSSHSSPSTKTVRVMIKGRVQGVFYRNWTIENASQLGLNGWVRNRRDGSVEALFCGKPELVDQMEQRCRRGPPDAMVTGLQVFLCNDDPGTGFQHKPTA